MFAPPCLLLCADTSLRVFHSASACTLQPPHACMLATQTGCQPGCFPQVTRIEVALANGTLASVTLASHPHLWRALQVKVMSSLICRSLQHKKKQVLLL